MASDERDMLKQQLRDSQERFRAVFDASSDAMAISDVNGIVVYANAAYFELYGYSPEEVIGKSFSIIFPEEQFDEVVEQYRQVFSGQMASRRYETTIRRKDGSIRQVESRIRFISGDGVHTAMLSIIRDITDQKMAEAALEQSMQDLKRSNADLEHYAYVASHDLQEPLRMVISYLNLLKQRYDKLFDADAHEFIGFALDGAARMKSMIDDILAYSRVKPDLHNFVRFSTREALNLAMSNLRLKIEDSGAVVQHDDLPEIVGSEKQFAQLFQNLISNAIKFRGDGPPVIRVAAERSSNGWLFSVSDNGIGIAPDQLERIFVMFQRLHPRSNYTGTGIGLAICRKVIEYHGGRIWAESEVGAGTTFYFTVPDQT